MGVIGYSSVAGLGTTGVKGIVWGVGGRTGAEGSPSIFH